MRSLSFHFEYKICLRRSLVSGRYTPRKLYREETTELRKVRKLSRTQRAPEAIKIYALAGHVSYVKSKFWMSFVGRAVLETPMVSSLEKHA